MPDTAMCGNCARVFEKNTHNHRFCKTECKVDYRKKRRNGLITKIASLLEDEEFHQEEPEDEDNVGIKLLFLDIETSPNLVWTWGLRNQFIGLNQIEEQTRMLCFSAKFYHKDIEFYSEFHHGREEMIRQAWRLLDEADVIIHWNGARFDVPHIQREFLEHGLGPTSHFTEIDLLKIARNKFRFTSNKLQNVSKVLGLEGKVSHEGFELWRKCMNGDKDAWNNMKEYNLQDVLLLEDLYEKLRPWITNHPNLRLYGVTGCPRCGSKNTQRRGERRTMVSVYQQYKCNDCSGYFRDLKRTEGADIRAT